MIQRTIHIIPDEMFEIVDMGSLNFNDIKKYRYYRVEFYFPKKR